MQHFVPWRARLDLGFARIGERTRLVDCVHQGPLRVQKTFYPEGPEVCQAIVVHPPGGVVGGDQLDLRVGLDQAAQVLLTTPGATKWYRANGRVAQQWVKLDLAAQASLEWLPQETIFYDAAEVQLTHTVTLAAGARYIGCEILCFGRRACGEVFGHGHIRQSTRIIQEGRLIWWEQGTLAGGSAALASPLGLQGKTVCATLLAVGEPVSPALLADLRREVRVGITQLQSLVVARYLGDSSEEARHCMMLVWQQLRPMLLGRTGIKVRSWET